MDGKPPGFDFGHRAQANREFLSRDIVIIGILAAVLDRGFIDIHTQGQFRPQLDGRHRKNARAAAHINGTARRGAGVNGFQQIQTQLRGGMRASAKGHARVDADGDTLRFGRIHPDWQDNQALANRNGHIVLLPGFHPVPVSNWSKGRGGQRLDHAQIIE